MPEMNPEEKIVLGQAERLGGLQTEGAVVRARQE